MEAGTRPGGNRFEMRDKKGGKDVDETDERLGSRI